MPEMLEFGGYILEFDDLIEWGVKAVAAGFLLRLIFVRYW
jgi:hypothetical protein